jgi:hypothetical protein
MLPFGLPLSPQAEAYLDRGHCAMMVYPANDFSNAKTPWFF